MAGEAEAVVESVELRCENCGAPFELRGFKTTRTAACEYCGAIFDTSGEAWQLVQKVEGEFKAKPRFELGTRGVLDGIEWEVIGWAERSVRSWGTRYPWEEHLLYNPYEGFRYLLYQDGHFAVVDPVPGLPASGLNRASYERRTYKHFSTADATVDEVLGEFPWQMRRGDKAQATDYVAPPRILSCEESAGEVNWSEGRYLPRDEAIKAFGKPSRPLGYAADIHPCQPNPYEALSKWMLNALMIGLLTWVGMTAFYVFTRQNKVVFKQSVADRYDGDLTLDSSKAVGTVEVEGSANGVSNNWVYYDCLLVNKTTNKASYVGLEISYYHGVSGGESWSEGSRSASTIVSGVPNGEYAIQLTRHPQSLYKGPVDITIRRDVPLYRYPCCTLFLVLIPALLVLLRKKAFEQGRWKHSDHGTG